jgi:hypothetical protein
MPLLRKANAEPHRQKLALENPVFPEKTGLPPDRFPKNREFPEKRAVYPLEKVADFRKTPGNRGFSSRAIDRKTKKSETMRGGQ